MSYQNIAQIHIPHPQNLADMSVDISAIISHVCPLLSILNKDTNNKSGPITEVPLKKRNGSFNQICVSKNHNNHIISRTVWRKTGNEGES
jgi:hypothetical protein